MRYRPPKPGSSPRLWWFEFHTALVLGVTVEIEILHEIVIITLIIALTTLRVSTENGVLSIQFSR